MLYFSTFISFLRREVSASQRLAPSGWCWSWLLLHGSRGLADESQVTLSDRGENTVELTVRAGHHLCLLGDDEEWGDRSEFSLIFLVEPRLDIKVEVD